MNKLTEYLNYLASLVFGVLMAMFIMNKAPPVYMVMLVAVWLGSLVRVGYLSDSLKALKRNVTK